MDVLDIVTSVRRCTKCNLYTCGSGGIPGTGKFKKEVMVVGINPGRDEDLLGEPFVGRSGKLLDKMLSSVGFSRDDLYITNSVKCWTPANREPEDAEWQQCKGWLWKEIQALRPKVIVSLGLFPTKLLLKDKKVKMKDVVGKFHELPYIHEFECKLLPNYHPSFILRNGSRDVKVATDIFRKINEQL